MCCRNSNISRGVGGDRCIGVGESVVKGTRRGLLAMRRQQKLLGGQMTGKRIYWLLGTIVTFGTTIYDDWNSGQFSRYTFAQRWRTTKVPNETPYQTGSISRSSAKKDSAVVSARNELLDRNNPPVLHLRSCEPRFSSRWNGAVSSRLNLDSLDGI